MRLHLSRLDCLCVFVVAVSNGAHQFEVKDEITRGVHRFMTAASGLNMRISGVIQGMSVVREELPVLERSGHREASGGRRRIDKRGL